MFKVVGKGLYTKETLLLKLREWGIVEADEVIQLAEKRGKVACTNGIRILLLGGSY